MFFVLFTLIGLIVIANLMLLSVRQRSREIALRRAEGASRGDVFAQFFWEGMIVVVIGLALGLLCGMALAITRASARPERGVASDVAMARLSAGLCGLGGRRPLHGVLPSVARVTTDADELVETDLDLIRTAEL